MSVDICPSEMSDIFLKSMIFPFGDKEGRMRPERMSLFPLARHGKCLAGGMVE
jgi:hypothetical protein